MIVREELNRIDTNASPVSSDADSLQQHDSLHGDDDEDRIPDELLLKYTKADSLGQDDFPVEPTASPSAGRSSRSGEQQRAQTPDKLPPEDPEETTYVTYLARKINIMYYFQQGKEKDCIGSEKDQEYRKYAN